MTRPTIPAVGEPRAERAEAVDVWIIPPPPGEHAPSVGTRSLPDRWKNTFNSLPTASRYDLWDGMPPERANRDLIVVEADGVMDPDAVEMACEWPLEPDAVLLFESNVHGLAPLMRVGARRSRQVLDDSDKCAPDIEALIHLVGTAPERVVLPDGYMHRRVRDSDVDAAEWGLLARLQWRPGGLIARYVNRPVSLRISRLLLHTRVTPNQVSMFAAVVGLVGVVALLLPGRWPAVLGALLLQANSIIDGIDGELARIRCRQSEFGAFLDSVLDETLNTALLAATGYYIFARGAGDHYLWMGVVGAVGNFAYAAVHWHCKVRHGLGFYWWWDAYKPRKQMQRSTSLYAYFKKLFIKESIYFLYIPATLLGLLPVVVWAAFGSGVAVLVLLAAHIFVVRARW